MDLHERRAQVEAECRRLTVAFREKEMRNFSDDCYARDELGRVLKTRYWEQLQKSCAEYYHQVYIDRLWKIIEEMSHGHTEK